MRKLVNTVVVHSTSSRPTALVKVTCKTQQNDTPVPSAPTASALPLERLSWYLCHQQECGYGPLQLPQRRDHVRQQVAASAIRSTWPLQRGSRNTRLCFCHSAQGLNTNNKNSNKEKQEQQQQEEQLQQPKQTTGRLRSKLIFGEVVRVAHCL